MENDFRPIFITGLKVSPKILNYKPQLLSNFDYFSPKFSSPSQTNPSSIRSHNLVINLKNSGSTLVVIRYEIMVGLLTNESYKGMIS